MYVPPTDVVRQICEFEVPPRIQAVVIPRQKYCGDEGPRNKRPGLRLQGHFDALLYGKGITRIQKLWHPELLQAKVAKLYNQSQ